MQYTKTPDEAAVMDPKKKKYALRLIPYGLYVLTARTGDSVAAATVSWVTQASFDPPRVVVALRNETRVWEHVQAAGGFVLNMLGTGQKELAARFFKHVEPEGNTIGHIPFHEGLAGAPILEELPAYLECRVVERIEGGDHTLFLAEVIDAGVHNDLEALTLAETRWHYGG